jgi:hypothetical protein
MSAYRAASQADPEHRDDEIRKVFLAFVRMNTGLRESILVETSR